MEIKTDELISEQQYLESFIQNNNDKNLTEEEFNLFRIYNFIKINLKDNIESNKTYIIPNSKILGKELIELSFKVSLFSGIIYYNNNQYIFSPEARIINIHHKNETLTKFIYNSFQLQNILDNLEITSFFVELDRNSNVSINEANDAFLDKSIVDIYSDDRPRILSKKNFQNRFKENIMEIKDISFNSYIYFENDSNKKFIFSKIYDDYSNKIINFVISQRKILFFLGQRRNSKSVFFNLLPMAISPNVRSLYLDIKTIGKLADIKTIKRLLYYEMLNLAANENEVQQIYNMKIFKDIKFSKALILVKEIISKLLIGYNNTFSSKYILVIIDNLYLQEKDELILNDIIELIKNNNKFKLVISGEGMFFVNKIKQAFLYKFLGDTPEDLLFFIFDNNLCNVIENNIDEEINYLNKYKIQELIHIISLDDKEIDNPQIILNSLNYFRDIPFYFNIYFNINSYTIQFKIENKTFRDALNKVVDYHIKKTELESIMSRNYFPRNIYGISEELLIILLLKYNKFNIKNLFFEFIIIVKEVNNIKYGIKGKFIKKLDYFQNVLILQEKYNGENYDFLIIQSLAKYRFLIFVQVGVDKNFKEIKGHYNNLKINEKSYIVNLENYFDCKIDDIYLLYIFDEDTQKEKGPNASSGSKICQRHNINFLIYSFNDRALKSFNNDKYNSINGGYYNPDFTLKDITI